MINISHTEGSLMSRILEINKIEKPHLQIATREERYV